MATRRRFERRLCHARGRRLTFRAANSPLDGQLSLSSARQLADEDEGWRQQRRKNAEKNDRLAADYNRQFNFSAASAKK